MCKILCHTSLQFLKNSLEGDTFSARPVDESKDEELTSG